MGKLVLFLADGTTLDIPLDRERMRIGRRPGSDLCLPYAAVSGEHAVILVSGSSATIEDLGSTNGTLVNGDPIVRRRLVDGDRIDIGRQQLVFQEDESAIVPLAARRRGRPGARPRQGSPDRPARHGAYDADTVRLEDAESVESVAKFRPVRPNPAQPPERRADDPPASPAIAVLSGPSAGRVLRLTKPESLIGRIGAQVVAIQRGDDGYRVLAVEGDAPPRLNGTSVGAGGAPLRAGDEIEVAGARLRFSAP